MKKLSFFLMAMLLALCTSTNVWAAKLTLDNLGTGLSSTSNTTVATTMITATGSSTDKYTLNYLQGKKQGNAILLAKGTDGGNSFISNKTPIPGNIKSITVHINSGASGKTTYHCAFSTTECTQKYTTGSTAVNIAGGNSNKYTCALEDASYFCVSLGNNNNGQVLKLEVEYEPQAGADVIVKTLKSIAIEGMTTTYEQGDIFKFDGTCTATYSVTKNDVAQADETAEVAPTKVSTPDMNTIGTKNVTVTYTEDEVSKDATYTITVNENVVIPATYTVLLDNVLWNVASGQQDASLETMVGKSNDITFSTTKGSYQLYANDTQTRFYANSDLKLSVPAGYVIKKIAFKEPSSNTKWEGSITVNTGIYTDNTKTWTGNAQEVKFSFGAQNRIATATVTYEQLAADAVTAPEISGDAEFIESTEVTITAEEGLKVYYTLDGTNPTNASTEYTAPFSVTATTTVKAVAYDGEKASDIASQTFKKLQVLTCEEAADACTSTESADKYVVRGYVTELVDGGYNATYNNTTLWMADTKNGGKVLQAFRLVPVSNVEKALVVGDYVEVIGNLVLWSDGTKEIKNGSIKKIVAPVVNHTIIVSANNAEWGTVTGGGKYEHGAEANLTATANEGYEFVSWTEGEEVVSTNAEYTFEVLADRNLVANFIKKTISYELNGGELPTATVPTQDSLIAAFKDGYNAYFGVSVATTRVIDNFLYAGAAVNNPTCDVSLFMKDDASPWKWLGDYVLAVTNAQIEAGLLVNLKELATELMWRQSLTGFFLQQAKLDSNYKGNADFTEAGKPEAWGAAYQAAHEVVLPTEPVTEDYVLPTPVKEGYTFVGWYDNAEGAGDAYTVIHAGWAGTLYAIWEVEGPATALENIAVEGKAVKAIVNGQLIIIKNGVQYNAQGQVVK